MKKYLTVLLERAVICQTSIEHWICFKGNTGETYEMGYSAYGLSWAHRHPPGGNQTKLQLLLLLLFFQNSLGDNPQNSTLSMHLPDWPALEVLVAVSGWLLPSCVQAGEQTLCLCRWSACRLNPSPLKSCQVLYDSHSHNTQISRLPPRFEQVNNSWLCLHQLTDCW